MQIKKIILENFKPFYGRNCVNLRVEDNKSVILIGGLNDRGKTSFFEGIKWCLYGFSGGYKQAAEDRRTCINRQAWKEGDGVTAVEIIFTHRDQVYRISRVIDFDGVESLDKIRKKHETVEVVRDPEGEEQVEITRGAPIKKYNKFISRILPEPASDFFFFDGEEIDEYAEIEIERREGVQQAIESVLGTQEIKTAISDLKSHGINYYQEKLDGAFDEQEEYEDLQEEYKEIEADIEEKRRELEKKRAEIEDLESEISNIENQLEEFRNEREKADEIKSLERDLEEKQDDLEEARECLRSIQSKLSTLIVGAVAEGVDQSAPSPQEGAEFIEYLLNQSERNNFLGVPISESEKEQIRAQCEQLKEGFEGGLAGLQLKLDEQSDSVSADLDGEHPDNAIERYVDCKQQFSNRRSGIDELMSDIAKLEEDIEEDLQERIDNAEEKKYNLELEKESKVTRRDQISKELDSLRNNRNGVEDEMEEMEGFESRIGRFQSLRNTCERAVKAWKGVRSRYAAQQVESVERFTSATFEKLTNKKKVYESLKITDDFEIQIVTADGVRSLQKQDPSKGARQIIAYSFIAGLNKYAAHTAPLVIDTPIARLDPEHKSSLLENLPSFQDQVIVIYQPAELTTRDLDTLEGNISAYFEIEEQTDNPDASRIRRIDAEEARERVEI